MLHEIKRNLGQVNKQKRFQFLKQIEEKRRKINSNIKSILPTLRTIAESPLKEAPVNEILTGAFGYCLLRNSPTTSRAGLCIEFVRRPQNPPLSYMLCIFVLHISTVIWLANTKYNMLKRRQQLVSPCCQQNAIKDPHWYVVQGSDTTMMPIAASLPGQ